MANNRLMLKCSQCPDDTGFYFLKYYPTPGWYIPFSGIEDKLQAWLDKHMHRNPTPSTTVEGWQIAMWGDYLYLEYEVVSDKGVAK